MGASTQEQAAETGLEDVEAPRLKNRAGRLTAFGKAKSLQIGMDGIVGLKDPVVIIQELMTQLNMSRDVAKAEYDRAEVEFRLRHKPFTKEQCDAAVQFALRDVLTDKGATASARVTAAKEFHKLYGEQEFDDDEARFQHYESLWARKISVLSRKSHEQMVELRDYIASEEFDIFSISEREVDMLEEAE